MSDRIRQQVGDRALHQQAIGIDLCVALDCNRHSLFVRNEGQPSAFGAVAAASSSAALKMTSGEVRKVDVEQGKVTIKHEAIENLEMPRMTMVFTAANPALLKDFKTGDKVLFRAEKVAGGLIVTDIQSVK